jgi:hypothetical protein
MMENIKGGGGHENYIMFIKCKAHGAVPTSEFLG